MHMGCPGDAFRFFVFTTLDTPAHAYMVARTRSCSLSGSSSKATGMARGKRMPMVPIALPEVKDITIDISYRHTDSHDSGFTSRQPATGDKRGQDGTH